MKPVTRIMFEALDKSGEDICKYCSYKKQCDEECAALSDEEFDNFTPDKERCYDGCMKTFGHMAAKA